MMFKRIDHVEIVARDVERSIEFYRDIFGFELTERIKLNIPPMREVVYMRLGDTVLELISVTDPEPLSQAAWQVGYRALAIEVSDMAAAVAYLKSKGIEMSRAPMDLGNSWRGEMLDPDGLLIELREWK